MHKLYKKIFHTQYSFVMISIGSRIESISIEADEGRVAFHASTGAAVILCSAILLLAISLRL